MNLKLIESFVELIELGAFANKEDIVKGLKSAIKVTKESAELTDEEIMKTCIKHGIYDCISDSYIKDDGTNSLDEDLIRFAKAILRKAQEK